MKIMAMPLMAIFVATAGVPWSTGTSPPSRSYSADATTTGMPYVPKRPKALTNSSVGSSIEIVTGPIFAIARMREPMATRTAIHAVMTMPKSGDMAM